MSECFLSKPPGEPRVLVLEDETRMRQLLIEVLPEMGYRAVEARTAEQAMRLIEQAPVDMVMLDLNLPVTDGMSFLRQLRGRCPQAPVVIMTGFGNLEAAKEAIRHGVVGFLTKPCDLGEIEAALGRGRQRLIEQWQAACRDQGNAEEPTESITTTCPAKLVDIERSAILQALHRHNGNRTAAAIELGISRRTLYNRMLEYQQQNPD